MKSFVICVSLAAALAGVAMTTARAQRDTTSIGPMIPDTTTTAMRAAMDSAFARARRLVMSGQTAAGRQIGDSIAASTREGTETYGEALYGLAMLAPTASAAAVDYGRIIVEYPLSAHAGDALLQLAQIERSQGDRASAIAHLQRYLRENPTSSKQGTTGLWLAQLLFEQNDDARGCGVLSDARAAASPSDVELQNQMNFYSARCAAVVARAIADSIAWADSIKADSTARATALKRPAKKKAPAMRAPNTSRPVPTSGGRYSVQLAAYETKTAAENLVQTLHRHGVDARVDGDRKPFRVRVGHYKTLAEANTAAADLKRAGYGGFIASIDGR